MPLNAALTDLQEQISALSVNVKEVFGAVGDGVTDDTAAVQAAIDAGGVTYFPPGTYICTTLQMKTGTVLAGAGRSGFITTPSSQASTIKLKNGTNASLINGADQVSNVVIRNLNFDGNKANNASGNIINLANGSAQDTAWHITDCFLNNSANDGIFVGTGRQAVRVSRTWVMRSDNNGIVLNGNDGGLSNVLVGLSASNSVYIGASVQHLTDCDFWSSTGRGIVNENASMVSISGCGIDRHQLSGVNVISGDVVIRGCLFHSNGQAANNAHPHIKLDAGQTTVSDCIFGADGFANNPNYAILAAGTATVRESGNQVAAGSYVTGYLSDVTKVVSDSPTFQAYDHGYTTWTHSPDSLRSSGDGTTAGVVYLAKVKIPHPTTVDTIHVGVVTAGTTLTAGQNFVALYNSSGTLLATSADQAAAWATTGRKDAAITAQFLAAGSYYVAILANGTTPPVFATGAGHGSASTTNGLLTTATSRFLTSGAGQTAMPASITLSSGTPNSGARWAALSA
ncbi:hypothetical protein OHA71_06355 [Streptomyces sp. NBC_00444]|uniref:glycosyl hydrolase family 28-related protein n=1 Tax=Streptomyces sp. NBC_00444 TaxID=2975744 RepID=UPI002E21D82B